MNTTPSSTSIIDLEEPIMNFFLANNYTGTIKAIRSLFPITPPAKFELLSAYSEFLLGDFKGSYVSFAAYLQRNNYQQTAYLYFELSQFLSTFHCCKMLAKDYATSLCKLIIELRLQVMSFWIL